MILLFQSNSAVERFDSQVTLPQNILLTGKKEPDV